MKVQILALFAVDIPDDLAVREQAYGFTDPVECIKLDMTIDPAAFLLDNPLEDIAVLAKPVRGLLDLFPDLFGPVCEIVEVNA